MNTVKTEFGEVSLDVLVKRYETQRKHETKNHEKRKEFLNTDEGKEWNRAKVKQYYENHKAEILAKRKAYYENKKKAKTPDAENKSESSTPGSPI